MTTKERIKRIFENQPEDAACEEIFRELAFAATVERGLMDLRKGNMVPNEEVGKRIRLWQK